MPFADQKYEYFAWFCRIYALCSGIVMCGVGIEAVVFHHMVGVLMIVCATVIMVFEMMFAVNLVLKVMIKNKQSRKMRCWRRVLSFDGWKRGIMYIILTIPCFVQVHKYWLGAVAGGLTLIAGFCYCIKTLFGRQQTVMIPSPRTGNYDRFGNSNEMEYGPVEVNVMPAGSLVVDFPVEANNAFPLNNNPIDECVDQEEEEHGVEVHVSDKKALDSSPPNSNKKKKHGKSSGVTHNSKKTSF